MRTAKDTFRSLEKEGIEFQVPKKLARLVRNQRGGYRSLSIVGTEILARGLGLDPSEFGVTSNPEGVASV